MAEVTIYHNPDCGTSRNALALIRHAGIEPTVIEYLRNPPDRQTIERLVESMQVGVRAILREKGTPYRELGLDNAALTAHELIGHVLAHPILLNRPIVVTQLGTALCRPSEVVLELLPAAKLADFVKEDGEAVVDAGRRRG